jgi:SAM-dependent methyltransferase
MNPNFVFERSGLAALSDLSAPAWSNLLTFLEREQEKFLAQEPQFRSPDYPWPRDPLHTFSRIWEYPYAYHHLKRWKESKALPNGAVAVDVGSGATFFPFSVARLGFETVCVDPDPICCRDLGKAVPVVDAKPGSVRFLQAGGDKIPFPTGGADAVYCISVLEHLPSYEGTVAEMARMLKPGGLLILTIDISADQTSQISLENHRLLTSALAAQFEYVFPEKTIHPADYLHSNTGPYPMWSPPGSLLRQAVRPLGRKIKAALGWKPPLYLLCQGFVMRKK